MDIIISRARLPRKKPRQDIRLDQGRQMIIDAGLFAIFSGNDRDYPCPMVCSSDRIRPFK
jgi:hypothetical protein